jgi:RNA polymerase sigma-70 factor (ECF subfamily)
MWTKIDQYDPQYQITTWLYRIAFNECLGYINERNKKTSLNKLAEFGIEVGDEGFIGGDISQLIEDSEAKTEQDFIDEDEELQSQYTGALKAIQSLKPIYREIVIDRLLNNMKYEDIADKYDLPLQTIKNRILRGKRIITEELEK